MKALLDLQLFAMTVEAGSLTAAARRLGLTPAAASLAIKRLEAELGVPLLLRTTRRQRLTPQGERFLVSARQALDALAEARACLQSGQVEVLGHLQVSVPSDLGRHVLRPALDDFLARHPQIRLRLHLSDRLADVFGQPVDVLIRYGAPSDSSLVCLPLAPHNRRVLVAAPDYLRRHGPIEHPRDLAHCNALCYTRGDAVYDTWLFTSPQGEIERVEVRGDRVADDGEVVRAWALAGRGVAYKSRLDVEQDLQAGRLVAVCPLWQGEPTPLNLLCADRRQLSPAVRLLHAHLQQALPQPSP